MRAEVLKPIEIIRQATLVGAESCGRPASSASSRPGAYADLIVVDGDPLKDLGLFQDQGEHLRAIMKAGVFHKNELN